MEPSPWRPGTGSAAIRNQTLLKTPILEPNIDPPRQTCTLFYPDCNCAVGQPAQDPSRGVRYSAHDVVNPPPPQDNILHPFWKPKDRDILGRPQGYGNNIFELAEDDLDLFGLAEDNDNDNLRLAQGYYNDILRRAGMLSPPLPGQRHRNDNDDFGLAQGYDNDILGRAQMPPPPLPGPRHGNATAQVPAVENAINPNPPGLKSTGTNATGNASKPTKKHKPRRGYACECGKADSKVDDGFMVQCERVQHGGAQGGWFHISCAGLTRDTMPPDGETFWCFECQGEDTSDDENENAVDVNRGKAKTRPGEQLSTEFAKETTRHSTLMPEPAKKKTQRTTVHFNDENEEHSDSSYVRRGSRREVVFKKRKRTFRNSSEETISESDGDTEFEDLSRTRRRKITKRPAQRAFSEPASKKAKRSGRSRGTVVEVSQESKKQIVQMGFTPSRATKALMEAGGDISRALDWLFGHPDDQGDLEDDNAARRSATPAEEKTQRETKNVDIEDKDDENNGRDKNDVPPPIDRASRKRPGWKPPVPEVENADNEHENKLASMDDDFPPVVRSKGRKRPVWVPFPEPAKKQTKRGTKKFDDKDENAESNSDTEDDDFPGKDRSKGKKRPAAQMLSKPATKKVKRQNKTFEDDNNSESNSDDEDDDLPLMDRFKGKKRPAAQMLSKPATKKTKRDTKKFDDEDDNSESSSSDEDDDLPLMDRFKGKKRPAAQMLSKPATKKTKVKTRKFDDEDDNSESSSSDEDDDLPLKDRSRGKKRPAVQMLSEPPTKKTKRGTRMPRNASATPNEPRPAPSRSTTFWTDEEKTAVQTLMREVIRENQVNLTEQRWKVIAERLQQRYNISRTHTGVKNYWNREGREVTGIDERRNQRPDKMVTGKQDPASRRIARSKARKSKTPGTKDESDSGNDVESNGGDSDRGDRGGKDDEFDAYAYF